MVFTVMIVYATDYPNRAPGHPYHVRQRRIARRSFGTTVIQRHMMTGRPLQRDGFIWKVRRKIDRLGHMAVKAQQIRSYFFTPSEALHA